MFTELNISPVKRACGYLEGWPPGFPAKRNHACSRLVLRLARRNGSVRCGRVCSKIVYSVRIGPPQPFREAGNHWRRVLHDYGQKAKY